MAEQIQRNKPEGEKLFGTLLSSKPARTRTPFAIGSAIVLHVVAIVLLAVLSKPFIPRLAHKIFEPVGIVIPEEQITTITLVPPLAPRAAHRARPVSPRSTAPAPAPGLVLTPGPIQPIQPPTQGPETVEPGDGGAADIPSSLAERLRPRVIDPRLGAGSYQLPADASPAAAVRARIAGTITAFNDSIAAEEEARRRGLDWTLKTKDGKQWGIGPDGKIHLGNITLPPLVAFTQPAGRRDEFRARARDYAEIERMASNEIGRQSFNQRVKAIRARKDKERQEKKKAQESAPISER